MGAQDNTEKVLRSLHVLLSKSEPYPKEPSKVIIDKQQVIDLLAELNTCIYQIMDEYELTIRSRDKAERDFHKKGDQIIWDASRKAEDIYAASVMYMDETLNRMQDIMQEADKKVGAIYQEIKEQMEKEEQELRTNKSELKGQLQDLVDTEKYLKIIEERNREIEKEKMEGRPEYEQEKREEKAIYANRQTDIKINQEYLDKLGLSVPETIDDVKHIALTFAEENPANQEMGNIGLAVSTTLYGGTGISSEYGMNLIFASFGAYPGRWLTDAEGMPVYGSVQPNVKDALGMLADWYQEGVLDRDFLIRTQDDIADLIAQGRCGIFFAPWWAPNNPLWRCHETDPEADWQPFLIRTGKDGSVRYCNEKLTGNYVVVRKGYEYPEIVPKILSVMFDYMRYSYDDPRGEFQQYYTGNIDPTARPLAINLDYNQALTICYENLQAALNGEKSEDELEILERSFEKVCRAYLENPKTASAEEWSAYLSRIKACSLLSDEKIQRVNTIYPTRTKTTEAYRYTLKELESETFLKIIRGESELSSFDDFVKEWQEEGGDEIIQEMIQERKSLSSQEDQKAEEKTEEKTE